MITTAELAAMRAIQQETMTQTATIQRTTLTTTGLGGKAESTTTVADDVPCRVAPSRRMADLQRVAGRLRDGTPWRITFPAGQDVREKDRITIDDGRQFAVLSVEGAWTVETARVCMCVEA